MDMGALIPIFGCSSYHTGTKFQKSQSSSIQNLLRITFIPLEIGNNVPIVFQILCRSMTLPFELPAVPPRSPLITLDIQIAVSSAVAQKAGNAIIEGVAQKAGK